MKTLFVSLTAVCTLCLGGFALADVVEVPITVDPTGNTYAVTPGVVVPTTGDYYYTYTGHRCYTTVQTATTVNGEYVEYTGTPNIYCYTYTSP